MNLRPRKASQIIERSLKTVSRAPIFGADGWRSQLTSRYSKLAGYPPGSCTNPFNKMKTLRPKPNQNPECRLSLWMIRREFGFRTRRRAGMVSPQGCNISSESENHKMAFATVCWAA